MIQLNTYLPRHREIWKCREASSTGQLLKISFFSENGQIQFSISIIGKRIKCGRECLYVLFIFCIIRNIFGLRNTSECTSKKFNTQRNILRKFLNTEVTKPIFETLTPVMQKLIKQSSVGLTSSSTYRAKNFNFDW